MRNILALFILLSQVSIVSAQNILVLKNGKRISCIKLDVIGSMVEAVTFDEKLELTFHPDSVVGYCSPVTEKSYYIKRNIDIEDGRSHEFLERVEAGRINLYKKMGLSTDFVFYMEKGDRLENVFSAIETGKKKKERFKAFASFVSDDQESVSYINDSGFKFKAKDVVEVVQYYNRRNFEEMDDIDQNGMSGNIILYRTKFQRVRGDLDIECLHQTHNLKMNDYITLKIPIESATKVTITGEYFGTDMVLTAELMDQYFEVVYNQKTKKFQLDKKEGSELQYEFYRIKNKVDH